MSCGCNSNPCSCPPACCTPATESVTYTFENANMAGIGVFDNDTDYLVQFRGLVSDAAALTITLNAADNTLVFDFDGDALIADIPDASTTQRGILETATNGEALAKAATDKILVPSNLAALGSTTSFAGLVELATSAETITGTSTTLAVTPAGLAAAGALYGTVTFADAATRGAATPAFAGQFGTQTDTSEAFIAGSGSPGDWDQLLVFGNTNSTGAVNTTITNTGTLTFNGVGSGQIHFTAVPNVVVNTGSKISFQSGSILQLVAGSVFTIANSPIPASQVVLSSSTPGELTYAGISTFISTGNTQTGYTAFSNPATLRTCDTATVTLQQLAQIVGTLVEDLKAIKLPAT